MRKPSTETSIEPEELGGLLRSVGEAEAAIDRGAYIRHEDMRRWLLSWGTDNELSPPSERCADS